MHGGELWYDRYEWESMELTAHRRFFSHFWAMIWMGECVRFKDFQAYDDKAVARVYVRMTRLLCCSTDFQRWLTDLPKARIYCSITAPHSCYPRHGSSVTQHCERGINSILLGVTQRMQNSDMNNWPRLLRRRKCNEKYAQGAGIPCWRKRHNYSSKTCNCKTPLDFFPK